MIGDEAEVWEGDLADLARRQGSLAILSLSWDEGGRSRSASSLCDIGAFLARYARPLPSDEELAAMDPLSRVDAVKTAKAPTAMGMIGVGSETTPGFSGGVAERDMARACAAALRSLGGKGGSLAARDGPGLRTWRVLREPIDRMEMRLDWRDPEAAPMEPRAALLAWMKEAGAEEIQADPPHPSDWSPQLKERVLARLQSAGLESAIAPAPSDRSGPRGRV